MATVEITNFNAQIEYPTGSANIPPAPVFSVSFNVTSSSTPHLRYTLALVVTSMDSLVSTRLAKQATELEVPIETAYTVRNTLSVPLNFAVGETLTVSAEIIVETLEMLPDTYVYQITEQVAFPRYSYATSINPKDCKFGYIKALGSFPNKDAVDIYAVWESSVDGIHNTPVTNPATTVAPTWVKALPTIIENPDIDIEKPTEGWIAKPYYKIAAVSSADEVASRPDILPITIGDSNITYSFRLVTLKSIKQETLEDVDGTERTVAYTEDIVLSYAQAPVLISGTSEVVYNDLPISTSGKIFYKDSVTYSYGTPEHKNNIMGSNPGELVTPLSKLLDLPASNSEMVTALCAWRDYIVSTTPTEVFLTSKVSSGYVTKTVSTFVGIPEVDGKCIKATANGIIFKSGTKVFTFYPNAYGSDESVLRLTDISQPVESLIEEGSSESPPFAISTERAYWLFMPDPKSYTTKCLKYQYVERLWTYHEYPVLFKGYASYVAQELKLYGVYSDNGELHMAEYALDADVSTENVNNEGLSEYPTYGDRVQSAAGVVSIPISFELDSGQKTDRVADFRQFVETKFNMATLNPKSNFPFVAKVHVDGCPFVTTLNVNSESPFWKTDEAHAGTCSTLFDTGLPTEDTYNTFRQGYLRYSGKGRSVRHILTGQSLYPFKIYEIDYRYRNLNVKK